MRCRTVGRHGTWTAESTCDPSNQLPSFKPHLMGLSALVNLPRIAKVPPFPYGGGFAEGRRIGLCHDAAEKVLLGRARGCAL